MNNSFLSSVLRFGSISMILFRNFSRTMSKSSHSVRKCNSCSTLFSHLVHTLSSRSIFFNRPVFIARSWFPHLNLHIFLRFSLFFITRRYGSIEKSCLTRLSVRSLLPPLWLVLVFLPLVDVKFFLTSEEIGFESLSLKNFVNLSRSTFLQCRASLPVDVA